MKSISTRSTYLVAINLSITLFLTMTGCTIPNYHRNIYVPTVKSELISPSTPSKMDNKFPTIFLVDSLPRILGQQHINLTNFTPIALDADQIKVSSYFQNYTKNNLLTDDGFWHIQMPKISNKSWISIDLRTEILLTTISIRPRNGYLSQLWTGGAAVLEGSNDGGNWTSEVILVLDHELLNQTDWISFILPESVPAYRHYRIYIDSLDFISMSGLRLYKDAQ